MNLKCIVIDDDPLICDLIQHFCSKVSYIEYCISCEKAIDGLTLLTTQPFDILFLDYNMPDIDGKSLLEMKKDKSQVVMITSNESFAVESYNYPQVIDFIVKPVSFDRFYRAVERANTSLKKERPESEILFVKDGNKFVQVRLEKLVYIKSESNYVMLSLEDKKIMSLITMKELEGKLPSNFIRIHRSYIINIDYLESISPDEISIQGNDIPIGLKYKKTLTDAVSKF